MNAESRARFVRRAEVGTFRRSIDLQLGPWRVTPSNSMTCIRLDGHSRVVSANVWIALLKESLGLGSTRYCVLWDSGPYFYSRLKMIMSFLPHEKMFLYPAGTPLEGPFLSEPWLSRGRALCSRPSLTFTEFHDSFPPPNNWRVRP